MCICDIIFKYCNKIEHTFFIFSGNLNPEFERCKCTLNKYL